MRIFAFHLLNDYSGSPKVLSQLVKAWSENGMEVHLCSSFQNDGFLSSIVPGVVSHKVWYRFYENKLLRLFALFGSQVLLFLRMLFVIRREDIVYVNTVLPFGASLLGKLKGCRVMVHVHETTMKPMILKRFLFGILRLTADDVVYVSKYLAHAEPVSSARQHVVYNAIADDFVEQASRIRRDITMPQNVLMICSLKWYKGLHEFVQLADSLPRHRFRMVINAGQPEIDQFFSDRALPDNLELYPTQKNVIPHYAWADVIMNLSRPDGWVETFGLTIIEGMAFGMPAIVPPVGGITEVVDHGYNGFQVDSRNSEHLREVLLAMLADGNEYRRLSSNAKKQLMMFSEKEFVAATLATIKS